MLEKKGGAELVSGETQAEIERSCREAKGNWSFGGAKKTYADFAKTEK